MKIIFIILITTCITMSCGIYGNTSDQFNQTHTVCVGNLKNIFLTNDPDLGYKITNQLQNKFRQDFYWQVVDNNGSFDIQGEIIDYKVEPILIGADQTTKLNRVTLSINIQSINKYKDNEKTNEIIAEFIDYDAHKNIGTVRDSLHNILVNSLAGQIYNRLTNKW